MKKIITAIFVLSILFSNHCYASNNYKINAPAINSYYKKPDLNKIPKVLESLSGLSNKDVERMYPFSLGFFAIIFKENPNKIDSWLNQVNLDTQAKMLVIMSLWFAGLADKTFELINNYQMNDNFIDFLQINKPNLLHYKHPSEIKMIDTFRGAFSASGNKAYIIKIIKMVEKQITENDVKNDDALFMFSRLDEPNSKKIFSEYEKDKNLKALFTASTGLWVLGGAAKSDDKVQKIIQKYIKKSNDKRIKAALQKSLYRAKDTKPIIVNNNSNKINILSVNLKNRESFNEFLKTLNGKMAIQEIQKEKESIFPVLIITSKIKDYNEYDFSIKQIVKNPKGKNIFKKTMSITLNSKDKNNVGYIGIPLKPKKKYTSGEYTVSWQIKIKNTKEIFDIQNSFLLYE